MNTTELGNHLPFLNAWAELPYYARRVLKQFAQYPTEKNECYTIGYITALSDSTMIGDETYSYLLSLCGQLRQHAYIIEGIESMEL